MASALAASCLAIPCTSSAKPSKSLVTTTRGLSVLPILSSSSSSHKSPLTFSSALSSLNPFPIGGFESAERSRRRRGAAVFVCEAAPAKKADSAAKRARQAEKRRVYNKSKKSEMKTRMRKVYVAYYSPIIEKYNLGRGEWGVQGYVKCSYSKDSRNGGRRTTMLLRFGMLIWGLLIWISVLMGSRRREWRLR